MVQARADGAERRVRVAMVGGGQGAFIGAVHRMAMRLDDAFALVAGALSSDPERAAASARDIGLDPARSYASYDEMMRAEAARPDGAEAVAIVTPNHMHAPVALSAMAAGLDVICDKPLTTTLQDAHALVTARREAGVVFAVTLNNTGYAMVRQMRAMIAEGAIGRIRVVHASYMQDWLSTRAELDGLKQAEWRTDPARSGRSAALADIGVHAQNLAHFVTQLALEAVSADLATMVDGRVLDDNAHVMLRFKGGARGMLTASQVAPGHLNDLSLKVYGDKGGLAWSGLDPEALQFTPLGEPTRTLARGGPHSGEEAQRASRMPARHPEGYIEAFANLYRDAGTLIRCRRDGTAPPPEVVASVPTVEDGALGMAFIEAAVNSSQADGRWTEIPA